jgi:hypothetical protein
MPSSRRIRTKPGPTNIHISPPVAIIDGLGSETARSRVIPLWSTIQANSSAIPAVSLLIWQVATGVPVRSPISTS